MESKSQKKVAIPASYLIVHAVAVVIFALGAGALFLSIKDALIHALPLLGHPDVAWTLFIGGIVMLIGNQVRFAFYIARTRQRAKTVAP